MQINIIEGSQRRNLPDGSSVLFLLEGRCDYAGESYVAPLALSLIFADGEVMEYTQTKAVLFSGTSLLQVPVVPDQLSRQIVRETFFEFTASEAHRTAAARYVLYRLEECEPVGSPLAESPVATGLAFMQAHLDADLKLDDLCEQLNCSKSGLLAAFRREGCRAPIQELARLRLERACELLKENELTVAQIARTVGYKDLSAFNHFFSRHTGSSPRRYRENCLWLN